MWPRVAFAALVVTLAAVALLLGRSTPRSGAPLAPIDARAPEVAAPTVELAAPSAPRQATQRAQDAATEALHPAESSAPAESAQPRATDEREPTVTLIGRIIGKETRAPIAGVDVHVDPSAGQVTFSIRGGRGLRAVPIPGGRCDAVTDEQGLFEIEVPATGSVFATCVGAGWSPRYAELRGGETVTPAHAGPVPGEPQVVVELERAARIEGRVDGAPERTFARVTFRGGSLLEQRPRTGGQITTRDMQGLAGDQFIQATVSPSGEFELPGLPARVPLTLALFGSARHDAVSVLLQEPEPVTLQPGQVHRVEWSLADSGSIVCTVRGAAGMQVEGIELWLVTPLEARSTIHRQLVRPSLSVTTDASGRAEFTGVRLGEWAVALAPRDTRRDPRRSRADHFARYAVPCTVAVRGEVVRVELEVRGDLYIEGVVSHPAGEALDASVYARSP